MCFTLLAACLVVGCGGDSDNDNDLPVSSEKESVVNIDGFILQLSPDEQFYTVAGYEGEGGAIAVPGSYSSVPVMEIGEAAFRDNTSVSSVILPDSVYTAGNEAFAGCSGLKSVGVPDGLEKIGMYSFTDQRLGRGKFSDKSLLLHVLEKGVNNLQQAVCAHMSANGLGMPLKQKQLIGTINILNQARRLYHVD